MATKKNTTEVQEVEVAEEITFSAKDLAIELNIDAKTFRRWCRANLNHEKGSRWIFTDEARLEVITRYSTTPEVDQDDDES